jgi:hypothetical protein
MRGLAAAALTLALLVAAGGESGAKQTYCQKTIASQHGKVVWNKHGVIIYRVPLSGGWRSFNACSDSRRHASPIFTDVHSNAKPALIQVAAKHCVAIVFTAPKQLPELALKDLAENNLRYYGLTIGGGNASAKVGSLATSSNCAAAWGDSVTDGSGSTSYHVRAVGFGKGTSLSHDAVTDVATVQAAADTKKVGITSAGKRVKVTWTEAGAAKQATLP